jgi:anti-sigma-K factor RskA
MTTEKMTLERLRAVIEAYGTSTSRWPAAEREAAAALLGESAAARALVTEAAPLDELLDAVPPVAPTPAMRAAILAMAPRAGQPVRPRFGDGWRAFIDALGGWRLAGAVLAASLVLGIVSGGWLSAGQSTETSPDLLQLALLDDSVTEY